MALNGLTITDWTSNIGSDLGKTMTITPATKSVNNRGDETLTDGSTFTATVFMHLGIPNFKQGEEGLYEDVVGYIQTGPDTNINKDDKITYDSRDYRIGTVRARDVGLDKNVFKHAVIYLWEK